ncbi:MAG: hypothetical protein Q8928_14900 [Bacteroidota bacterium]|nr:hypothetical protein [Bacteroidota bacterium]
MAQIEEVQIDLSYLMSYSSIGDDFVTGMLDQCIATLPEVMTKLKQTLEQQDWKGLRMASHKFIPILPLMGFGAIVKNMKTIEIFSEELSRIPDEEKAKEVQELVMNAIEYCDFALPCLLLEYEKIKNN